MVPAPTTPRRVTSLTWVTLSAAPPSRAKARCQSLDPLAIAADAAAMGTRWRPSEADEPRLATAELGRQRGADADQRGDRPAPHADPWQELGDAEQQQPAGGRGEWQQAAAEEPP